MKIGIAIVSILLGIFAVVAVVAWTQAPKASADERFVTWMSAHHYSFWEVGDDGGKMYDDSASLPGIIITAYPNRVEAFNFALDDKQETNALLGIADIMVAAIEAHGLDPQPVRAALAAPHEFPLNLQAPGYVFLFRKEDSDATHISARVTFAETK